MKRPFAVILISCCLGSAWAQVSGSSDLGIDPSAGSFGNLDLSASNTLLYTATSFCPAIGTYDTLFLADIPADSMTQLTFFPESIVMIGDKLQIQNRFGLARTDETLSAPKIVRKFPSFVDGDQIQTGKILPIASSANGSYILYLEQTSIAYANLVLFSISSQTSTVVTKNVDLSLTEIPAAFAPNSELFIYSKAGSLYYYSLDQYEDDRVLAESYRCIGSGTMASVMWTSSSSAYYLSGSLVYHILNTEFFTRALYTNLLTIGTIVGKIPFSFDPNFDEFKVSSNGKTIMVNKEGRNIFLYTLQLDDFQSTGQVKSFPNLLLPRNTRVQETIWTSDDLLTFVTRAGDDTVFYRLDLKKDAEELSFESIDGSGVSDTCLSPDQKSIVLVKKNGVSVRDYLTWTETSSIAHENPMRTIWKSNYEIIVAGAKTVAAYSLNTKTSKLVCLSQAGKSGYSRDGASILTSFGADSYSLGIGKADWQKTTGFDPAPAQTARKNYRVYLENYAGTVGAYRNMVMVRNLSGLTTKALFAQASSNFEKFPDREEAVDLANFSHGSRLRAREVALVFNTIDSVEGLNDVLDTLEDYGIKATFFLNGEFMRRHPGAVSEIANAGHEVGSLFFTYFNMTDSNFQIESDFVKRGLARNEDDYYDITGRELSLLWHAPHYFVNTTVLDASASMNYTYVGRDVDMLDWVSKDSSEADAGLYQGSSGLIERAMRLKKPGSIIPIRIGIPDGGRDDYVFQKVDILVNALTKEGYSIVPVSRLIENAR